jgi:hypothetical protein
MADQTVEGVRNAEDGRQRVWNPVATMTPAEVAKRERQPHGRSSTPRGAGRTRNGRTLKRSEAHGRMNPFAQASGERRPVETAFPVGNDEDVAGVGNQ